MTGQRRRVRLSRATGPPTGPLALCLHGFPDTAHTWRYLLPRLADAGYHAVAPFLRGYAPTAVPADGRYDTGTLALDACALHEALGGAGDAVIIGHDWGAFATYGAAADQPERWRRVVTAAVAPQASMADGFFPSTSSAAAGTCSSSRPRWPSTPCRWTTTPSSTGCGPTGHPASTGRGTRPGSRRRWPPPRA